MAAFDPMEAGPLRNYPQMEYNFIHNFFFAMVSKWKKRGPGRPAGLLANLPANACIRGKRLLPT